MDSTDLIDRLAAHRTLATVPRDELVWLTGHGEVRRVEAGTWLVTPGSPLPGLLIVLEGHLTIRIDSGSGPRVVMEWRGGDVTGVLPYSRIKNPPGNTTVDEPTDLFVVAPEHLPQMIRDCPNLTAVLVHVMLDRARVFTSTELRDEKMASLGRLSAGLAHELNNPASAVVRSAKTLADQLSAFDDATKMFCALGLPEKVRAAVDVLRAKEPGQTQLLSPLDRADRLDAIADWLADRGIGSLDAEPLAQAGLVPSDLNAIGSLVGPDKIGAVLAYVSTGQNVRRLAMEIHTAAERIHSLVAAVKSYTYVNQQATLQPIAIDRGLSDTVTVLRSKAKERSVNVELQVQPKLPAVDGYGGELNQVWSNLIENAIDATPSGRVRVKAEASAGHVVVRVIDDGPGIPAEIAGRIFEPFFTTKEIGKGTGLGLDIARRIVEHHRGQIDVSSHPGGTEFRVTLPASTSTADASSH
jgi:signal transduction histidine kinase